jgi:hypothetical protein
LSFTVKAIFDAKSDSDAEPGESETVEVLRESAFYWQKHLGTIRTMFQPVTQALIEEFGLIEGDAVLEVAGGSGEPSLTMAESVYFDVAATADANAPGAFRFAEPGSLARILADAGAVDAFRTTR